MILTIYQYEYTRFSEGGKKFFFAFFFVNCFLGAELSSTGTVKTQKRYSITDETALQRQGALPREALAATTSTTTPLAPQ